MENKILFVVLDLYADWEGAYLSSLINNMGQGKYEVRTVSLTKEPIHSIGGFTLLPDHDIQSAPSDYAAVILIGGNSWRKESAKQIEPLVRDALKREKIIGGICDGSVFLGTLGVLNGVNHTSNLLADLQEWAGSNYTSAELYEYKPAVRDKNIITANGTAALEFAREVLIALDIVPEGIIDEWYDFYKLGAHDAPMPGLPSI